MQTLTQAELNSVLSRTSPHSFKHNVTALCIANGLSLPSEPSADAKVNYSSSFISELAETIEDTLANRDSFSSEEFLTRIATTLGDIAIGVRSVASVMGIPLEDVQDAIIGCELSCLMDKATVDRDKAVATMMFGVKKRARHPYEYIVDSDD